MLKMIIALGKNKMGTRIRTCMLHSVLLFANPWTVARQAPLSMGFFRQKYWNGLPFPSTGDLPDPGIKPKSPVSPVLQADSLHTEPLGRTQSW